MFFFIHRNKCSTKTLKKAREFLTLIKLYRIKGKQELCLFQFGLNSTGYFFFKLIVQFFTQISMNCFVSS